MAALPLPSLIALETHPLMKPGGLGLRLAHPCYYPYGKLLSSLPTQVVHFNQVVIDFLESCVSSEEQAASLAKFIRARTADMLQV